MRLLNSMNIINTYLYISASPFFWASMGMITATAMFIGAILYNGDLKKISKALISIASYSFLLLAVTTNRIYSVISISGTDNPEQALAGILTIFITTIFYFLGMFLGVLVTKSQHK